jgi:hypothetical protein
MPRKEDVAYGAGKGSRRLLGAAARFVGFGVRPVCRYRSKNGRCKSGGTTCRYYDIYGICREPR